MAGERLCAGANGEVALLIDFWNLAWAVEQDVDCEALFRFAGEHGRVAAANAYADWGADEVSRYQGALRGLGVEAVQVPVRSDPVHGLWVRMAVDAVELTWSAPQVGLYVLVAGDAGLVPAVEAGQRQLKLSGERTG